MSGDITEKLEQLDEKIDRLNKERNLLIESNKRMVNLVIEMENFIEQNVRAGELQKERIHQDGAIPSSETISIEKVKEQISQIEKIISEVESND